MNVLVDNSVWSLALRRKPENLGAGEQAVADELGELIQEGRVRMIGLVRQELLSGIKSLAQYDKLCIALRTFRDEPLSMADHEAAAKAANECRAKGLAVSVVDMILCQVALSRRWAIFTTDPDFARYAAVLPITLHAPRLRK